jgi:hypothetical protein
MLDLEDAVADKNCQECGFLFKPYHINTQRFCEECRDKGEWFLARFNVKRRLGSLAYAAKNRANAKNLPYNINTDFVIELWEEQGMQCPITGRMFDLESWGKKAQVNPDAPSIDRIDPTLGYVKGNVRLVTYSANVCLNEYGHDYLLRLCEDILAHKERNKA